MAGRGSTCRIRRDAGVAGFAGTLAALGFGAGMALGLASCALEEVTLVDPEDVVVAEAHLQLDVPRVGGGSEDRLTVFLHRTLGPGGASSPVPGASVRIVRPRDGFTLELASASPEACLVTAPVDGDGSCYRASPEAVVYEPGDTLELFVELPGGRLLESRSVVPGDFRLQGFTGAVPDGAACALPRGESIPLVWSRSEGAWAYVAETVLRNLTEALAPQGVTVAPEDDPLYLLGLSVSAADTTIVYPGEFGLFERFDLDQDVAVALQDGLPPPGRGDVTITAADRNYVNWVRGGNFNPSGQVRVPSIRGDGTGVFGTTVVRSLTLVSVPGSGAGFPRCPGT